MLIPGFEPGTSCKKKRKKKEEKNKVEMQDHLIPTKLADRCNPILKYIGTWLPFSVPWAILLQKGFCKLVVDFVTYRSAFYS